VKDFKSKAYEAVLNSYIEEGSLQAKDYFEKHKDDISPEKQAHYIGAIKNNQIRYKAIENANYLATLPPVQAYTQIDAIKDIDERNATESEYNRKLRHQDTIQQQKDIETSNQIMQQVFDAFDKGEDISSIMRQVNASTDMSLEQKEKIYKNLKEMQELQGAGNNWADFEYLKDMAAYNNDEFKNINPANYNLTKAQYQKITDMQRNAANNTYNPEVELQKAIHKVSSGFNPQTSKGLKRKEYEQGLIKFISKVERMRGKAFNLNNTQELESIIKAFDYKDPNAANKNIDETKELYARALKHGEVYNLMAAEYMNFKGQNKREPTEEEIYEMAKRSYNTIENNWRTRDMGKVNYAEGIYKSVNSTKPKQNETKVLTYYADVRIPQMSRELGIPLKITSRYRPASTSTHSLGRKCDVSMSEHTRAEREKIFEAMLAEPAVASIGTSDPHLLDKYNNPPNPKIRNLKGWDAENAKRHPGTTVNHVNHIDISFDTRYGGDKKGT
ncbi:MAG: hypothetical protein LUH11_01270, partial [Candidatus Gastranaerophilales bacterium]|nr:hypothetical protein [Candidatus Gastranaerophilales bacterium]